MWVLIDTSSLVHFLRRKGDPEVKERVRRILRNGSGAICPMVETELAMGVASESDGREVRMLCDVLFRLPIDDRVWREAVLLAGKCRASGSPVPSADVVIAATAFVHGAEIEAADAHFDQLQELRGQQ